MLRSLSNNELHFTENADSRFQLYSGGGSVISAGPIVEGQSTRIVYKPPSQGPLELESRVYYCDDKSACRSDNLLFQIPVVPPDEVRDQKPTLVQHITRPRDTDQVPPSQVAVDVAVLGFPAQF